MLHSVSGCRTHFCGEGPTNFYQTNLVQFQLNTTNSQSQKPFFLRSIRYDLHSNTLISKLVYIWFDNNKEIDCQFDGKVYTAATNRMDGIVIECTKMCIHCNSKTRINACQPMELRSIRLERFECFEINTVPLNKGTVLWNDPHLWHQIFFLCYKHSFCVTAGASVFSRLVLPLLSVLPLTRRTF